MIRYLLFAAVLLLIVGRLRRPLLSAWRLVLPLSIAGIIGWCIVNSGRFMCAPSWMKIVGPLMAALMVGGPIYGFLRDNFPSRRDKDAR